MDRNEATVQLWRLAILENIATLVATAAIVIGLYWLGAGAWCFWGLALMVNLNGRPSKCDKEEKTHV